MFLAAKYHRVLSLEQLCCIKKVVYQNNVNMMLNFGFSPFGQIGKHRGDMYNHRLSRFFWSSIHIFLFSLPKVESSKLNHCKAMFSEQSFIIWYGSRFKGTTTFSLWKGPLQKRKPWWIKQAPEGCVHGAHKYTLFCFSCKNGD